MSNDRRFAVLIDADNISDKYIKVILDEISNDGVATYKRIYGDWTKPALAPWKKVLLEHSVMPMQQYGYTTGKNATDSAMIIDAMDILYSGNVEGFCLVTSDSDFTRLASRLRESGMLVVGMGEQKTPKAFISACNKFKYLDILSGQAAPKTGQGKKAAKTASRGKMTKAEKEAALAAVRALEEKAAEEKAAAEKAAAEKAEEERLAGERAAGDKALKAAGEKARAFKEKEGADKEKGGKEQARRRGRMSKEEKAAAAALAAEAKEELKDELKSELKEEAGAEAANGTPEGGKTHLKEEIKADPVSEETNDHGEANEREEEIKIAKDPRTGKYRPEDLGILMIHDEDELYGEEAAEMTSLDTIREAIATMVSESADEDEWVFIGDIGNRLTKRYPDFDVRNYGFSKLTPFIKSLDLFDIKSVTGGNSNNKLVYVRERE